MRQKIASAALVMGLCCASAQAQPGEGELNIIAWPGYVERGQTDLRYDWASKFERETGCKVRVRVALNSDEMVNLMTQGGFDLVSASGDASLRLIFARRVAAIDPQRMSLAACTARHFCGAPIYCCTTPACSGSRRAWLRCLSRKCWPTAAAARGGCRCTGGR